MENELGELFGWLIMLFYGLTILNYFVKFINKRFRTLIAKNDTLMNTYSIFMKVIIKQHRIFGLLTVAFILIHFAVQYNSEGWNLTGTIAASLMVLEVLLGIYGAIKKKRAGIWFVLHRSIAVLLAIAILVHLA